MKNNTRLNSISIVGGAFGDEGKGKVVDEIGSRLVDRFDKIIVYRWNGGSNAGHTVELQNKKVVLHQIPSGAMIPGAICILGKGMVINPPDFVTELSSIIDSEPSLMIDEMAVLSLDTHRAFESSLKKFQDGYAGSTGRGISPAYADIIYRHPLRARDLLDKNWNEKFEKHYLLYKSLIKGLGENLEKIEVNNLDKDQTKVGNKTEFIRKISESREKVVPYIKNVYYFIKENWKAKTPFIFEGAQGVGVGERWGVYPDVSVSDPTPSGIFASTEGIVDPYDIEIRANVYKATYTSSVGTRVLPPKMNEQLAARIREDANEYGATTKRPRDIYHIDIPALSYFAKVSMATHMILTHLDVSYSEVPIKVCTKYVDKKGQPAEYRPDQEYLNHISAKYEEFKPWDGGRVKDSNNIKDFPSESIKYINYLSKSLNLLPLMVTTGPKRNSVVGGLDIFSTIL